MLVAEPVAHPLGRKTVLDVEILRSLAWQSTPKRGLLKCTLLKYTLVKCACQISRGVLDEPAKRHVKHKTSPEQDILRPARGSPADWALANVV